MNQQPNGHIHWPDTYCDECGQPTTKWPGDHYALCIDCATNGVPA